MCLNRARQRRRHRRTVEDWAHLYDHAANADMSPEFQLWMAESGWQWQMKEGDSQVSTTTIPPCAPNTLLIISILRRNIGPGWGGAV
jgi:hypothetical protein